jgi:hypothetical protein
LFVTTGLLTQHFRPAEPPVDLHKEQAFTGTANCIGNHLWIGYQNLCIGVLQSQRIERITYCNHMPCSYIKRNRWYSVEIHTD